MLNVIKFIKLKQKLKKNKTPWIKVPKEIIKKYRDTTNKNKNATDDEIKMKIVRAFYSGSPQSITDERDIILYGYLTIKKDNEKNRITYIQNNKDGRNGRIDFEVKSKITSIYGSVFGGEI